MKKNIVIIILSIVIIIMGIGYAIILSNDKTDNISNNKTEERVELNKNEHYKKMLSKMDAYYKIYFRNLKLPTEDSTKNVRVTLKNLKTYGFPMEDFVSYDGKDCDLDNSYAIRKLENEQFNIRIYYKCGEDSNYKQNTTIKKTS